jgi:predicted enzyme related to lactoylglutathione lyase
VTQFQILTRDPALAERFYAGLFGWKVSADNPLGYRQIDTGSPRGIQGGIWPAPPEANGFVQLFVEVDDVAAHFARAQQLGAKPIVPPQKLPQGDELAILLDPQGISFGLFRSARGSSQ